MPLVVLPTLNKEILDDVPIEEAGEMTLEETGEALDETEFEVEVTKVTLGTE